MSRTLTAAADTALSAEHVAFLVFVQLEFASGIVRVCNAGYDFQWNGFTWLGAGNVGSIQPIQEGAELQMYGVAMQLSGVNVALVASALGEQYQGLPAKIWVAPLGRKSFQSGTAQAGAASSLTLAAAASSGNDYNGKLLKLTDGSARERRISDYNGTTKVATVASLWPMNLCWPSDQLEHANWWKSGGTVVTANAALAPDGTLTADRVNNGVGFFGWILNTAAAGVTYTWLIYAKSATGSNQNTSLFIEDGSGGFVTINVPITVTPDWQIFTITGTAPAVPTLFRASIRSGDFYCWRGQFSIGSVAPEPIQTVGSVIALPDATTTYDVQGEYDVLADPAGPFQFRMDTMSVEMGDTATITLTAESPMAAWDRPRTRRYTSEDQAQSYPADRFFEFVPALQSMEILF